MIRKERSPKRVVISCIILFCLLLFSACAQVQRREMVATAYCGCQQCCGWTRGSGKYLKLNFWNRYYESGPNKGVPYKGHTASGTEPRQYNPGLISVDSLTHPWMIPVRIVLFPWLLFPYPGTIAADTRHYPFGTRMTIPGYGKGIVEDRGSAIKGPNRIDLFYRSHGKALQWGKQKRTVTINK
jgi:3D (Asp-Asp-Asp) domain-containing protein